ncbi:MAG: hypothetical protein J6O62_02815 [Bacilli bacterium]|nr:hypothetical protein [Bacilli bacterium]MBO6195584.1 hypothetical protein [Bacilli bacterium]
MNYNKDEIDKIVEETFKENKLNKVGNIYLSNKQINILERYKIDYKNVVDMSELIFKVEEYIEENDSYEEIDDLENLSLELSEFNYYYNTNK